MIRVLLIATITITITAAASALAAPGQSHYVKPLQANIHESASADAPVKFVIAIGRKLIEFQRKDGFIQVGIDKAGGRDGWISEQDIAPTDPDGIAY